MIAKLTKVRVAGFRSLREVILDLTPVTLLIGPNGSGKSNLLSVLRMVPLMRTQSLRRFVGEQGGASALLHYGASVTRELELGLDFATGPDGGRSGYHARLGYAAGDTLVFLDEAVSCRVSPEGEALSVSLGAGHAESVLAARVRQPGATTERVVNDLIARMSFFHFHDTSPTSPLRQNARRADDRYLRSDGSNLAAFLYRLRASESDQVRPAWNRISGLVRRIAPFIKDLEPGPVAPENLDSPVRLYWTDERDHRFDVHDLSDGTLRAIALIAALAQPADSLPGFITIDEPELGLHPAALSLVAALVGSVSKRCQVLLSTQSPALLDEFSPGEVVVTERRGGETGFRRLSAEALAGWLEDYSLSELYDKNVLGGRP